MNRLVRVDGEDGAKSFPREALDVIEGSGSYGIWGGKRVFVSYDQECKVRRWRAREKPRYRHNCANDPNYRREAQAPLLPLVYRIVCGDSEGNSCMSNRQSPCLGCGCGPFRRLLKAVCVRCLVRYVELKHSSLCDRAPLRSAAWQPWRGMAGGLAVVCVGAFHWNGWQEPMEYADEQQKK